MTIAWCDISATTLAVVRRFFINLWQVVFMMTIAVFMALELRVGMGAYIWSSMAISSGYMSFCRSFRIFFV